MRKGSVESAGRKERMPELPEVETLKRELQAELVGKEIKEVFPFDPKLKGVRELLMGKVESVKRHGKLLILGIEDHEVSIWLGMSGRLQLGDPDLPPRLSLTFGEGTIHLIDPRRFARIGLKDGLPKGIDPFDEKAPRVLFERTRGIRRPIKSLLIDQDFLLGLGNIYSCESLFRAKINPFLPSCDLKHEEWRLLLEVVKKVLEEAISLRGTTFSQWRDLYGQEGLFRERLMVYGREKEPCVLCGALIRREVLQGRGTWFCPNCQKED